MMVVVVVICWLVVVMVAVVIRTMVGAGPRCQTGVVGLGIKVGILGWWWVFQ